jgi:hypothetical protein
MRRLPGLYERLKSDELATSGRHTTTWAVLFLPQLERDKVYKVFAAGGTADILVPVYVCPTDSTANSSDGAQMSYVANGGRQGPAASQNVANGPYLNLVANPNLSVREGNFVDGREYTFAFSENTDATFYDTIGWNIWSAIDTEFDEAAIENDNMWGVGFFWSDGKTPINVPGTPPPGDDCVAPPFVPGGRYWVWSSWKEECGAAMATYARPSSQHGGGVNVAFSSGRAMFLRESIDPHVYIALMTLDDEASDSWMLKMKIQEEGFILEDKHFQ